MNETLLPSQRAASKIFQFKVKLSDIDPPIWRRVQVFSTSTFSELSDVIQRAMGWEGYHLHSFTIKNITTGKKDQITASFDDIETYEDEKDEATTSIDDYFSLQNKKARYVYDFGDNWQHDVVLEKILEQDPTQNYPRCIAGERACPPEDCGGIWGYEDILTALSDPTNPENEERLEWCGDFIPEEFDYRDVKFS